MSTEAKAPANRPLRADAERNRVRILDAARRVFAARGLGASLDDVAAEAGVGVGTVYRRFPDKEALVDALFEQKIVEVTDLAKGCLDAPDGWSGFEGFVRGMCALQAKDLGLRDVLAQSERGRERVGQAKEQIAPVVSQILRRAKEEGSLREDIDQFDIPMLNHMIVFAAEATEGIAENYWHRPLQVVLDGLRADRNERTPLPGRGLDPEQFTEAMSGAAAKRGC